MYRMEVGMWSMRQRSIQTGVAGRPPGYAPDLCGKGQGDGVPELAIVAEDLTFRYGDLTAVDHAGFEVAEGKILGFLGPNGAGKSTMVKILTGQLRPESGSAMLLGMDISKKPAEIQGQIGVSFEMANLYEHMSAVENLKFFARLFGVKNFDARALLPRVGLGGRENDRVERYSKGMKQRLMVARAIVNEPRILSLDEPTDGLDPVSTESIRNIILEERDRGGAVFLTTHDMVEADKLSDRARTHRRHASCPRTNMRGTKDQRSHSPGPPQA